MAINEVDITDMETHLVQYIGRIRMFTFTLSNKLYKYSSITQYELTKNDINSMLSTSGSRYVLSTELTEVGNVHYHAIVYFNDNYSQISFINKLKKKRNFGFYHIKNKIESREALKRTCEYLLKDVTTTMKVLHNSNYKPEIIYIN